MKFSIYSEIQHHGGRSPEQQYGEVLEQIQNADRLGFDAYAIIEHFFFPKFSISANPTALFAAAAQRTERINFRTLLHALPYHNPAILAQQIVVTDILTGGRYEWGVGRGHGWIPPQAGVPFSEDARDSYEEAMEVLMLALENESFSYAGEHFQFEDCHIVPRPAPGRKYRIFLGGTSDKTYELCGQRGWAVVVPPLLPYAALKDQLDLYRRVCAEHGHEPDIVWIHACYLDEDRDTALREGREMIEKFIYGNSSPLLEYPKPDRDGLLKAGYGFYAAGIMESLVEIPYEQLIEDDYVWVGTPDEIADRIRATQELCEGISEISITVNPGGVEHWKAIKQQELFAARVIPQFRDTAATAELARA